MKKLLRTVIKETILVILFAFLVAIQGSNSTSAFENSSIPTGKSFYGNYLAARFAEGNSHLDMAIWGYNAAISRDRENKELLRRSYVLMAARGEFGNAFSLAKQYEKSSSDPFTKLLLAIMEIKNKNFNQAGEILSAIHPNGTGNKNVLESVIVPMTGAWVLVSQGDYEKALSAVEEIYLSHPDQFIDYQYAVMNDLAGKTQKAEEIFSKLTSENQTFRVVNAAEHFFRRNGNNKKADEIIEEFKKNDPKAEFDSVETKDIKTDYDIQTAATKSISEVLLEIGGLLYAEEQYTDAMIYLRMAEYLDGDSSFIRIMIAATMEKMQDFKGAIDVYEAIPKNSYLYIKAQMAIAGCYDKMEEVEKAGELLRNLSDKSKKSKDEPLLLLGEILMNRKNFTEAAEVFSTVLDRAEHSEEKGWQVYYARAICLERSKQWERAERDFLKTLELQPEQPDVLNYLAYSWLVQDKNINKAKDMLELALKLRPNDPHIIDSYGWALYKLRMYNEALVFIERANLLMPYDSTTNDHLGDIYWATGRYTESRYQWQRALKYDPEPEELQKIQNKLENGLSSSRSVIRIMESDVSSN